MTEKKEAVLHIRIDPDAAQDVKDLAKSQGLSISGLVRQLVLNAVAERKRLLGDNKKAPTE